MYSAPADPSAPRPVPSPTTSTGHLPAEVATAAMCAHAAARAVLGCNHLADDAVQEALVALWRSVQPPADLRGWLVTAVVHRSLVLRRRLLRARHHEGHAAAHCTLHEGCDNPLHHAQAHEFSERLDAAVAQLPDEQRETFQLYAATAIDYRDIAAHLRLPVGTVRSRLHRARRTLQRMLRDETGAG